MRSSPRTGSLMTQAGNDHCVCRVGKSRERASRVLLRTVESGAWRVMRKIKTLASLTRRREFSHISLLSLFLSPLLVKMGTDDSPHVCTRFSRLSPHLMLSIIFCSPRMGPRSWMTYEGRLLTFFLLGLRWYNSFECLESH